MWVYINFTLGMLDRIWFLWIILNIEISKGGFYGTN